MENMANLWNNLVDPEKIKNPISETGDSWQSNTYVDVSIMGAPYPRFFFFLYAEYFVSDWRNIGTKQSFSRRNMAIAKSPKKWAHQSHEHHQGAHLLQNPSHEERKPCTAR